MIHKNLRFQIAMPVILACCYCQENPGLESEESCFVSVIFVFAAIVVITFLLLFKNTVAMETWKR